MNLRQIQYFCEVVDAGSVLHAAERLFVVPTAVSMQVSRLEEDLGGLLLERTRRPMTLTPLGEFFYPRAKELLLQIALLERDTQKVAAGTQGWLGIGFPRSLLFSLMPMAIKSFQKSFPDVHLSLIELLTDLQPQHLRDRRIHIGISRFLGEYTRYADFCYTTLFDDPFVAALPCDHPLAARPSLRIADMAQIPFISYPKNPQEHFSQQMKAMLHSAGVYSSVAYEALEINTALALVGGGLGGTLVGRSVAHNNRPDVTFLPFEDFAITTSIVALTRAGEENAITSAFLEVLACVKNHFSSDGSSNDKN